MANTTVETIKDIVTILTPVALALIAYKQVQMNNKQKVIGTQIDGMKSELVEAVAGKNKAEGQLEGMEKVKQEGIDAAKVVADAPVIVQPVKIVEQTKTVEVTIKKEDTKK